MKTLMQLASHAFMLQLMEAQPKRISLVRKISKTPNNITR